MNLETNLFLFDKRGDIMEWVNFKVKEGEREKLKNDAHAHRMNISEYLRFLVEKERERMNNAEKNANTDRNKNRQMDYN